MGQGRRMRRRARGFRSEADGEMAMGDEMLVCVLLLQSGFVGSALAA